MSLVDKKFHMKKEKRIRPTPEEARIEKISKLLNKNIFSVTILNEMITQLKTIFYTKKRLYNGYHSYIGANISLWILNI